MRVYNKEGVYHKSIGPEFLTVCQVFMHVYLKYNVKAVTCTSAWDSKHAPGSYHYKEPGLGWDFRIWGVENTTTPRSEVGMAADEIRKELTKYSARYKVIYGDPQHLDHIHVEYHDE